MAKKILVVDDDLWLREMFYNLLSRKGYKMLTAPSGEEAIELIQKENPDLVLMDIKMPKVDGIQTLKKARERGMKNKIVMLTGMDDLELERQARLNGASGFLRKQLDLSLIVQAVDEILAEKPELGREILVVDDDPQVRDLLERFLVKKGFNPLTAANAEEALDKVKKQKPLVVLLDMKMPGMDGLMALKRIREISEAIGVVMITGVGDEHLAEEAMKLGAYDYIIKPLDLDYLEMCLLTKIIL